jgi:hypothetical protein
LKRRVRAVVGRKVQFARRESAFEAGIGGFGKQLSDRQGGAHGLRAL